MRVEKKERSLVKMLIFLMLLAACTISPVYAEQAFKLTTNNLGNKFHILDQVTDALPEFYQRPEYKELLKTQFKHDQDLFAVYKAIRIKHQKIPGGIDGNQNTSSGLFAPSLNAFQDPICDVFFTSPDLDSALLSLQGVLNKSEIETFKKVFTVFSKDLDKINEESFGALQKNVVALNNTANQTVISEHFAKVRKFYNASVREFKSILLLQSPTQNPHDFSGNCYGDHLIIRTPNTEIKDTDVLKMMISVSIHEATHHISANAPEEQKSNLSKVFLSHVKKIREDHFLMALEEPLVMATQILFVKNAYPEINSEMASGWFNYPLAQEFSIILQDYWNREKLIDSDFIKKCALEYEKSPL